MEDYELCLYANRGDERKSHKKEGHEIGSMTKGTCRIERR